MQRQGTVSKKTFVNHRSNKEFVCRVHDEVLKLNVEKMQLENGHKTFKESI